MIKVIIGNKYHIYQTEEAAAKSWAEKAQIFKLHGLDGLCYFAYTVLQRIKNGEVKIVYSSEALHPLVAFWNSNKPVTVNWLEHEFQYENALDALLSIRELEENLSPSDYNTEEYKEVADYTKALSDLRVAILACETDMAVSTFDNKLKVCVKIPLLSDCEKVKNKKLVMIGTKSKGKSFSHLFRDVESVNS